MLRPSTHPFRAKFKPRPHQLLPQAMHSPSVRLQSYFCANRNQDDCKSLRLPWWLRGKESACNAGAAEDIGLIPVSSRSPGRRGHGNPLKYSCLENPMDRGAWQATVHRVTKSRIQLKWFTTYTHKNPCLVRTQGHSWCRSSAHTS